MMMMMKSDKLYRKYATRTENMHSIEITLIEKFNGELYISQSTFSPFTFFIIKF